MDKTRSGGQNVVNFFEDNTQISSILANLSWFFGTEFKKISDLNLIIL